MSNVRNRLRALDELEPPEIWSDATRREPRATVECGEPSRVTKVAVIATAFAVALAAVGFLVYAFNSPDQTRPASIDQGGWIQGTIPELGASFKYPPGWHLQPFEEPIGHVGFVGAVVSNVGQELQHPDQGSLNFTSAWDLSAFPQRGVVISIEHIESSFSDSSTPDSQFPLSLSQGVPLQSTEFSGATDSLWLEFVLDGQIMGARVYFGPDASAQDRRIASDIVATIEPAP